MKYYIFFILSLFLCAVITPSLAQNAKEVSEGVISKEDAEIDELLVILDELGLEEKDMDFILENLNAELIDLLMESEDEIDIEDGKSLEELFFEGDLNEGSNKDE